MGKAALHLAAERGHEQVADVLLAHRAYVGAKSKLGMTPLHLAAENGYTSLVEMLVYTHKAQVDTNTLVSSSNTGSSSSSGGSTNSGIAELKIYSPKYIR